MAYTVEQANLVEDREVLSALWERNYGGVDSDRFEWLYYKSDANPMCFVIKTEEGDVVGMNGVLTRNIEAFGDTITIAHAIDFLIDKKHRTAGPAIQMQRFLIKELTSRNIRLIYGFPMPAAQLVLRRLGYQALGDYQRWVKPVSGDFIIGKYLPSPLSKMLSPITTFALQAISKDLFFRKPKQTTTSMDAAVDEWFNDLWERSTCKPDVIGERNESFVSWRFTEFHEIKYKVYTLNAKNGELDGYIVYQVNDGVASIHDLLAADIETYRSLLRCFTKDIRKQKVSQITLFILSPGKILEVLSGCGYMKRPEVAKVFVRIDKTLLVSHPGIADANSWYVTDVDKDVGL